MAKAPPKAAPQQRARNGNGAASGKRPRKGMSSQVFLVVFSAIVSAVIFFPTVLFLFIALMPTSVAYLVERGPHKYAWMAVGGTNLMAALSTLLDLWSGPHTLMAALTLLGDVFTVMTIYGGAAAGWIMYIAVPPVVGMMDQVRGQRRIMTLRKQQRALLETWGSEVAGKEPIDESLMRFATAADQERAPEPVSKSL